MKVAKFSAIGIVFNILLLSGVVGVASEVKLETDGAKVRLSWPAEFEAPGQGLVFPEYTIQRSSDLIHWSRVGGKMRGISGRSEPRLSLTLDDHSDAGFYRIVADTSPAIPDALGGGGDECFGLADRFKEELERIGLMTIDEFALAEQQPAYLPQLTWDPTTAAFWTNFYTNASFRLNDAELAVFKTNGFVVSERLGNATFGGLYYSVFHADLPVFVTADSVLQAWHRNYLGMLEELEELQLATLVEQVLTNMARSVPPVWATYGNGPLRESILDADYFLTVARSLWAGAQVAPSISGVGQQERVAATLADIAGLGFTKVALFGTNSWRWYDFSQFKVRGHYTNSERLSRYFRTMMWCGRTDLRLATYAPNKEDDIRQLGTAIVLRQLLRASVQVGNWSAVEEVTRAFVGPVDSMTFVQLGSLLEKSGINALADVPDLVTLTNLQTSLLTGELGSQCITSDRLYSPLSPEELRLPRSFTVFGQKFVLDSWAFSQVVFDKVHWPSDNCETYCGVTNVCGKVVRRKPTCLDVAFSVLGNVQVAPEIIDLILRTNGVAFRDGLPYQHNLTAVRNVVNAQIAEAWTNNIYSAWLFALRALSEPTTSPENPEVMRTRSWAMKTLNTQMASWTELRHDTVLYAKQSYTPPVICSYPYGFVEPVPEFWRRMRILAEVASNSVAAITLPIPEVTIAGRPGPYGGSPQPITCRLQEVKEYQLACLKNFGAQIRTLEAIATKELAQLPLSTDEEDFLRGIMEYLGMCGLGDLGYTGWYPGLFYQNAIWRSLVNSLGTPDNNMFHKFQGCAKEDALITDVHTDTFDANVCDPGAVIHEGVGRVNLLMIAVDNGLDHMVYAGPVFSHYEFEQAGTTRLSDEEWKTKISGSGKPAAPEWTRSYLVPMP
jgi:hypothetical protein